MAVSIIGAPEDMLRAGLVNDFHRSGKPFERICVHCLVTSAGNTRDLEAVAALHGTDKLSVHLRLDRPGAGIHAEEIKRLAVNIEDNVPPFLIAVSGNRADNATFIGIAAVMRDKDARLAAVVTVILAFVFDGLAGNKTDFVVAFASAISLPVAVLAEQITCLRQRRHCKTRRKHRDQKTATTYPAKIKGLKDTHHLHHLFILTSVILTSLFQLYPKAGFRAASFTPHLCFIPLNRGLKSQKEKQSATLSRAVRLFFAAASLFLPQGFPEDRFREIFQRASRH